MKKAKMALAALFATVVLLLGSCVNPKVSNALDELVSKLDITCASGDTKEKITSDFEVVDQLGEAKISWVSSDTNVIAITGTKAVVTRAAADKKVVLTATISLLDNSKTKEFELNVVGKQTETFYTITWSVDGSLTTTTVKEGVLPTNDNPVKEGYTFLRWEPQIVAAKADVTYTAVFEKNNDVKLSLEEMVNQIVKEDLCSKLPKISSTNFKVVDESNEEFPIEIYIELYDWDADAAQNYMAALDQLLDFNEVEKVWMYKQYNLYVYEDDITTDHLIYGISIYTTSNQPVEPEKPVTGDTHEATIESKHTTSNTNSIANGIINEHLKINNPGNAELEISFNKMDSKHSNIFNNSVGEIRLYPGNKNGGEIVIKINSDYKITGISVASGSKNTQLAINNEFFSTSINDTIVYQFSSAVSEVILKNVAASTSKDRVDIKQIVITYQAVEGGEVEPEVPLTEGEVASVGNDMLKLNEWQLSLPTKYSGVPSVGKFDVLVIPVEVKGALFDNNYRNKIDLVFNGTEVETGWQSVATYYYLSSYGKLDLSFDVLEKYSSPNDKQYFESIGELADEYAIYEAVMALNPEVDFTKYDYNKDGIIDGIIFVYSVEYSTTVDSWWAWVYDASYFSKHQTPTLDGLKLGYYMWVSYNFMNDDLAIAANVNAETYIHEMGHMLGQTDLYSGDNDKFCGPLGDFDMMDYNSGDHGPFTKLLWGWVDPMVCNPGYQYNITLDSYATDKDGINSVVLIPRSNADFTDKDYFDEYLLVIFYTPEGLYNAHKNSRTGVNEAGVIIYQIDARLADELNYWSFFLNDNNGDANFLAQILEADKNNSLPSKTQSSISASDFLTSGSVNLSSYKWNQGGKIDVSIELSSQIDNASSNASLVVSVR